MKNEIGGVMILMGFLLGFTATKYSVFCFGIGMMIIGAVLFFWPSRAIK